jgi:Uncharacterized iron-regulated protein
VGKLCTFRARRRSAAEKRVLLPIQRHISSIDGVSRLKYVQEFTDAFKSYQQPISYEELLRFCRGSDVLLVSDFHALDSCQQFLTSLLEQLAPGPRPLVLMLEMVFTRDQHILDEWQAGTIDDRELRRRLRFDLDWGYAWEPFLNTLKAARARGVPIYGNDCWPRGNVRRIAQRDRHAADCIATVRVKHPAALILVMFGESHLAPHHLPQEVRERLPGESVRSLLQNVDTLYFRAAGELREQIEFLQVDSETAAVFNATPVEKWQSYRLWLARWSSQRRSGGDFTPAVYDLIDALLAFLHIERYADEDGSTRYFVDCYPEVVRVSSLWRVPVLLKRRRLPQSRSDEVLKCLLASGAVYVPELNLLTIHQMRMQPVAQAVAAFVHHACRDFVDNAPPWLSQSREDAFYARALECALVDFGARVLYPSHPLSEEEDIFVLYAQPREEVEANTLLSYRDYMHMLDCVMLHRDYELHPRSYAVKPWMMQLQEFHSGAVSTLELLAQHLGALLGADLYRAYLAGRFSRRAARSLFFRKLGEGNAREAYFRTVKRIRPRRAERLAA